MSATRKTPAQKREEGIKRALRIGLAAKGMTREDVVNRTKLAPVTVSLVFSDPIGREFRSVLIVADLLGVNLFSDEVMSG